jgi:hypothetical protein
MEPMEPMEPMESIIQNNDVGGIFAAHLCGDFTSCKRKAMLPGYCGYKRYYILATAPNQTTPKASMSAADFSLKRPRLYSPDYQCDRPTEKSLNLVDARG